MGKYLLPYFLCYIVRSSIMDKYINRELSWLAFNERVLQESLDKRNPLVERLRFLGIYSNNMDEFFRVRVANINRFIAIKTNKLEGYDKSPKKLLKELQSIIMKQRKIYELSYNRLLSELEKNGIYQVNKINISERFKERLSDFFHNNIKQDIVPIILNKKNRFPRLQDKEIYLAVRMYNAKNDKTMYALIQVPSQHSRFITLSDDKEQSIIIIDDIIRLFLGQIFYIFEYNDISAYTFKFTRNADLNLDDDISIPLYEKIEAGIEKRKKGEPLRFVYDESMPKDLLEYLKSSLAISDYDHIAPGGRYHNFKDLINFPDFGNSNFIYPIRKSSTHKDLGSYDSFLKTVLSKDIFLHFPYQKFDHLVSFLREAAIDTKVTSIKITIYRVAKQSKIMNALINALRNGKEVTVVIELKARFDEENNMYWSNILRNHGAKIIYGVPGFKVHAKLIQVTRKLGKKEELLVHIGTGNFHDDNAKIYTDFSLFTSKREISKEVNKVFNFLENNIERTQYRTLIVSPFNTRRRFIKLINAEIKNATKGNPAKIEIKMNNLVDLKLINKLYEASQAGVKIKLIIRGMCCLRAGVEGLSDNIEAISIVGRYLEHGRFIIFHNNGDPLYYLSSSDWMTRNFDKRIEVTCPILDESIKKEVREIFDIQWSDSLKARLLDENQTNKYKVSKSKKINAQDKLFERYKN